MTALTGAAQRWQSSGLSGVMSRADLRQLGVSRGTVAANVRARRWQRLGLAIVLHNGEPSREQREQVALINCGPRSALTAFTGAAGWGLKGWHREDIHVLVPAGTRAPDIEGVIMHRVVQWDEAEVVQARRLHRVAPALVLAAGSCANVRTACGVVAAGVQQKIVTASALEVALDSKPKLRHARALRLALWDIAQGAHALSEIDLAAVCRRHGLPAPEHQAVRIEPNGRRRYLDALWRRHDGGCLAVEVDGALHLEPLSWAGDQLRQNEIVLGGTPVLRFPSVVIRSDERLVADQIRRGLRLRPA